MITKRVYPVRGCQYTLSDIANLLKLDDSPALVVEKESGGGTLTIQDSHLSEEDLLTVPGLAESMWTYKYTTEEWIPVFHAVDSAAVRDCLDIEPDRSGYSEPGSMWATPKGFPREQYEGHAGASQVLADEVGDGDPTQEEIDESNR